MEMQQRPSSSASRLSGEQRSIHITPTEHPEAKRRRTNDDLDGLPLYDPRSTIGKREFSHSRSAGKWIHAIPVLVLFCFFILWWFSFPGARNYLINQHPDFHNFFSFYPFL
ncbi:hypothetical protein L6164_008970 [Bauhinia variegata]|uniref:Uncharacterized protein n=1 Tax=Bauhinia variegata TaxID=167791 RepID=A0ACB9PHF1_BAUVA|nr:hypothetical protein L6164_008970 [Bauhinia variegata]